MRVLVVLYLSVEIDSILRRVARFWWPDVMEGSDVTLLSREMLRRSVQLGCENVAVCCVAGGGFPCQDVSLLNASRQGSEASRTVLYKELNRICLELDSICHEAGICFLGLAECVRMGPADEQRITAEFNWQLVYNCPSGSARARRSRTFWTNGVIHDWHGDRLTTTFMGSLEPTELWLAPGWAWTESGTSELRLPTFTRAIPRSRPAFRAPGLDRIDTPTRLRYESDGFRFPPYTYAREYCVGQLDADGVMREDTLRVACAAEREVLMGYLPGFTRPLLGRAARKRPDSRLEDCSRSAAV